MSFQEIYGPWAVIAGGSDGIGAAFAWELASRGLNLILIARGAATLQELKSQISAAHPGIEIQVVIADLSLDDSANRVICAASTAEVGCLVYNVGAEPVYGDFLDHDWEFIRGRMFRNFLSMTALTQHFGRGMRERGRGGVVLMGSMSGYHGSPGFALYSAGKAFTRYLAEGLWYEFKKHGVDLVSPMIGPTDTPTIVKAYGQLDQAMDPADVAKASLDNLGQGAIWVAEDIAAHISLMETLAPEERSTRSAKWAEDFARYGKRPG